MSTSPSPVDPIVSLRETANWLGVHLMTIRRLIEAGKLSSVRVSERRDADRKRSVIQGLRSVALWGHPEISFFERSCARTSS
jgi:excisionase family DNA binding protein